ncbi:MAG: efflux RND transporter periplasmic adaptor subunit [Pseudomonadota bacterium]
MQLLGRTRREAPRFNKATSISTVLAFLLILPLAACGEDQAQDPAAQAPPPSVTVAPVVREDVTPSFEFVGRVEAVNSVELRARVEGFLEKRNFEEGGEVKKGQLLFLIEQPPYQAQVDQAKAELAGAEATLENAKVTLARNQKLIERGTVSQASLDEATAGEREANAQVLQKKAALEKAKIDFGYTEIHAPIDGTIGRADITVGNLVGPTSPPLANIVSLDPIYVIISVSEKDLLEARRSGEIQNDKNTLIPRLELSDGKDYASPGKFDFIDNRVDPNTDTIEVRAIFPNPDGILVPDQFATVIIEQSDPVSALVVPQAAIQENQSGKFVLLVDDKNTVQQQRVTTGEQDGTNWVITEGLSEGQQVIVQGLQKVRPGVTVQPVTESAPADGQENAAQAEGN